VDIQNFDAFVTRQKHSGDSVRMCTDDYYFKIMVVILMRLKKLHCRLIKSHEPVRDGLRDRRSVAVVKPI
jgi:hypothetical protein